MERTKKEEKLILTYFLIFLGLVLLLILIILIFIYPRIKQVEALKTSTYDIYMDYKRIEKDGMNFSEFQSTITPESVSELMGEENQYLLEVVNSIDESFYNENLLNNGTSENYSNFLKTQSAELQEWSPIEEKNEIVEKVLPIYSELISDLGEGTLSDFKFINYVESIIDTFSLSFDNRIGISEVLLLDNYSVGVLDNSLETNIYYIPLSLNLSGRRADILDFLYFASHVGEVKIEGDDLIVSTDIDPEFRSTFRTKVLKGQSYGDNIFNNQMFDIETVEFDSYIDPLVNISESYMNSTLVTYIKSANFDEDVDGYKIQVNLRFYIKGLPLYKIEGYIRKFIQDFNKINTEIDSYIENTSVSTVDRQRLVDIKSVLEQFENGIVPQIELDASSNETINEAYNSVNSYYPTLEEYNEILNQVNLSLGNTVK